MTDKKAKNNGIYFLLLLSLFSFVSIRFSSFVKTDVSSEEKNVIEVQSPEECTTCGTANVEEEIKEEELEFEVYYVEENETISLEVNEEEVKGLFSLTNCDDMVVSNTLDSTKRICSTASSEIDFVGGSASQSGDKISVTKDSTFKMVEVTYPLAFWLGQYVFRDSNKQITKESPEYVSNGEQIDIKYQMKSLAPQEAKTLEETVTSTVRKDFSVFGSLSVGNAEEKKQEEEGEYKIGNIETDPECNCPEISNSDYNPGMANAIASDSENGGYYRQQSPGGDNYEITSPDRCLNEDSDFKDISWGYVTSCVDTQAMVVGTFRKIFGLEKWDSCQPQQGDRNIVLSEDGEDTVAARGRCIDTTSIAVEMTPIFGDPDECRDDLCTNAFLANTYRGTLSPDQSAGKKISSSSSEESIMFYIATPCVISIDGNNVNTKCLWDASPTLLNYKLQAKDKAPNQDDFPSTFETYWEAVKMAVSDSALFYGVGNN